MYYTKEKTRELLIYHIKDIARNWLYDDFISGYFTTGLRTLIDFKEHKLANYPYRGEGYCRATIEELQQLIDFKGEIPKLVQDAINSGLSQKGKRLQSTVIFHSFDGERFYVRLNISEEEAARRTQLWESHYRNSQRKMGF